mmetsp:Transcript_4345/g.10567  ORF Transcript_4345/g.10567 Transcript_4345/m.10567 type:complete len:325 (+) Transcript_4345:586-1560(+)
MHPCKAIFCFPSRSGAPTFRLAFFYPSFRTTSWYTSVRPTFQHAIDKSSISGRLPYFRSCPGLIVAHIPIRPVKSVRVHQTGPRLGKDFLEVRLVRRKRLDNGLELGVPHQSQVSPGNVNVPPDRLVLGVDRNLIEWHGASNLLPGLADKEAVVLVGQHGRVVRVRALEAEALLLRGRPQSPRKCDCLVRSQTHHLRAVAYRDDGVADVVPRGQVAHLDTKLFGVLGVGATTAKDERIASGVLQRRLPCKHNKISDRKSRELGTNTTQGPDGSAHAAVDGPSAFRAESNRGAVAPSQVVSSSERRRALVRQVDKESSVIRGASR